MSDERDSPGVRPLTWVTMGLLAFSWLVSTGHFAHTVTDQSDLLPAAGCLFVLVMLPHLLFGLIAWRCRREELAELSLWGSIGYTGLAAFVMFSTATGLVWGVTMLMGVCWVPTAWVLGIAAVAVHKPWAAPPADDTPAGDGGAAGHE